jgi:hypothetical protein
MGKRKVMVKFKVARRTPTIRLAPRQPLPRPAGDRPAPPPGPPPAGKQQ